MQAVGTIGCGLLVRMVKGSPTSRRRKWSFAALFLTPARTNNKSDDTTFTFFCEPKKWCHLLFCGVLIEKSGVIASNDTGKIQKKWCHCGSFY
jgi:hypothetical protein